MLNIKTTASLLLSFCAIPLIASVQPFPPVHHTLVAAFGQDGLLTVEAADFSLEYEGCCNEPPTYTFITPNGEMESLTFDCTMLSQQILQLHAVDCLGNEQEYEVSLFNQDNMNNCDCPSNCCNPVAILQSGMLLNMTEDGITINADDYNIGSYSPCGNGPLSYSFSPITSNTSMTLDCYDLGFIFIQIWVTDTEGNQTFVATYAQVDDNGVCAGTVQPCQPAAVMSVGLAVDLLPDEQPTPIFAHQFDQASYIDDCSAGTDYTYSFSADVSDQTLFLNCDDVGNLELDIYLTDITTGEQSIQPQFIIVQNSHGDCGLDPQAPPNDNVCGQLISLDPLMNSGCAARFTNVMASAEAGEMKPVGDDCTSQSSWCPGDDLQNSVWFTFTAPASGAITIEASHLDVQLAIWESEDCSDLLTGEALMVAANDQKPNGLPEEAILEYALCLVPGKQYYLQVDGSNGASGYFDLLIEDAEVPCDLFAPGGGSGCGQAVLIPNGSKGHGNWLHVFESITFRAVMSLNDRFQDLGFITPMLQVNDGPVRTDAAGTHYLDRNWLFNSNSQPAEDVVVRFYFSQDELDALSAASPLINQVEDLIMTKVSDGDCENYAGGGAQFSIEKIYDFGNGMICVQARVPDFSGFYLHGDAELTSTEEAAFQDIEIHPNPTEDIVSLQWQEASDMELRLFDVTGRLLISWQAPASISTTVNLTNQPSGLYLLQLQSGTKQQTLRIIKL